MKHNDFNGMTDSDSGFLNDFAIVDAARGGKGGA
jgi:hypothetical protein